MKIEREIWYGKVDETKREFPRRICNEYVRGTLVINRDAKECYIYPDNGVIRTDEFMASLTLIPVIPESLERVVETIEIGASKE